MGSTAKLNGEQWLHIRHDYENPGANVSSIARRFGISRTGILKRAKREGWKKGPEIEILPPLGSGGGTDQGTGAAPEDEDPKPGLTDPAKARLLDRHQREWSVWRALFKAATKEVRKGGRLDADKLSDAMDIAKVLTLAHKSEREAYVVPADFKPPVEKVTGDQIGYSMRPILQAIGDLKRENEGLKERLVKYEPVEG